MANRSAILETVGIIKNNLTEPIVVVVSALAGVTDCLLDLANSAVTVQDFKPTWAQLRLQHLKIVDQTVRPDQFVNNHDDLSCHVIGQVENLFVELERVLFEVTQNQKLFVAAKDLIVSFGERLSAQIVAAVLREQSVRAVSVDARDCLVTDDNFTDANVDFENTRLKVLKNILPLLTEQQVVVVTGFIGATLAGETTTIGRGGSDYTAAILASLLPARELWIWKEVDGVLSADPRVVPEARLIEAMSYQEAAELSYFGAKILHFKTMLPIMRAEIPVRLRNTFAPLAAGTVISSLGGPSHHIKAVTAKKAMQMVTVEGVGMAGVTGFAAKVFAAAARAQVNLVMFSQSSSEQNICLLVESSQTVKLKAVLVEDLAVDILKQVVDPIKVSQAVAVIAVVGDGMRGESGTAAQVFAAVASCGVNILAIAQGSSERIISFVVLESEADKVVRKIHAKCLEATAKIFKHAYEQNI